ncbi:MAG: hypothetical protein AAGU74_03495 [Bacillota bacterium]
MLLALALAAIIVLGLLWNGRIKLSLCIYQSGGRLDLTVLFFYTIIRVHVALRLEWSLSEGISIFLIHRNGETARLRRKKNKETKRVIQIKDVLLSIKNQFITKRVEIDGMLGIADDAFACVMLTGALQSALFMTLIFIAKERAKDSHITLKPNFTTNIFRLNLEGIFIVRTVHIITAVFRQFLKSKGVSRNVTPD